jgi:hypothetical protein
MTTELVLMRVPPEKRVEDPKTKVNVLAWLRPSNQQWAAVTARVLLSMEEPHTDCEPLVNVMTSPAYNKKYLIMKK